MVFVYEGITGELLFMSTKDQLQNQEMGMK